MSTHEVKFAVKIAFDCCDNVGPGEKELYQLALKFLTKVMRYLAQKTCRSICIHASWGEIRNSTFFRLSWDQMVKAFRTVRHEITNEFMLSQKACFTFSAAAPIWTKAVLSVE